MERGRVRKRNKDIFFMVEPSRRDSIMTIMSFCRSISSFSNSIWLESWGVGGTNKQTNIIMT